LSPLNSDFPDMKDIKQSLRTGMLIPLKILAAKAEVTTVGFLRT